MVRITTSPRPPAPLGITTRMGLVGHSCAQAAPTNSIATAARIIPTDFMLSSNKKSFLTRALQLVPDRIEYCGGKLPLLPAQQPGPPAAPLLGGRAGERSALFPRRRQGKGDLERGVE